MVIVDGLRQKGHFLFGDQKKGAGVDDLPIRMYAR
jgi:hypothetical protein